MQAPPRIRDPQYARTEPSARCAWWASRICAGWRPGKHVRVLGYYGSAVWFGVHIWEYLEVLFPLLMHYSAQEHYGPRAPMTEWYRARSERKKMRRSWVLRTAQQRGSP